MQDHTTLTAPSSPSLFRTDNFVVPPRALSAFMDRVRRVDRELASLPGCRQHLVLVRQDHEGADAHVVTIVEWSDAHAMSAARAHMQARYAEEGFDPAAFMRSLDVRADMGTYRQA